MKRNEIAILIIIVGLTGMVGYFGLKSLLAGYAPKPMQLDASTKITSELTPLNKDVFRDGAVNPTVKVKIGDQSNQQPFNSAN